MQWRRRRRRISTVSTLIGAAFVVALLYLWSSRYIIHGKNRVLEHITYSWTTSNNPYSLPTYGASRFLAYLPHSGFHNQRIELENALVLSKLLNRTLVLPLARLGANPLPYKPFDELLKNYVQSDKSWLSHCHKADTAHNSTVKECRKFERYTHISWQDIVDIARLKGLGIDMVERWDFGTTWFGDSLRVHPEDIYWLKDTSPYEFQFYDDSGNAGLPGKYLRKMSIQELDTITRGHALLHLGTLFGTSRLRLTTSLNKALRTQIRTAMKFTNPFLLSLANRIVSHMGGQDSFYAAHLRLSDGLFSERAISNAHGIWEKLLRECYTLPNQTIRQFGLSLQVIRHHTHSSTPRHVPLQGTPSLLSLSCHTIHDHPRSLSTPLFIATDALSPRTHPALDIFSATFPCLFYLAEFQGIVEILEKQVNPLDGSPMARFLLPFVDALVASRAASIIGTPESTFSRYIEDILWPVEHGLEIRV